MKNSHEFIVTSLPGRSSTTVKHIVRSKAAKFSAPTSIANRVKHSKVQKVQRKKLSNDPQDEPIADQERDQFNPAPHDSDFAYVQCLDLVPMIWSVNIKTIPAAVTPIFYLPYIPAVISNYLGKLALPFAEVDGPDETGLLAKSWFPMVLHSPTAFQVIMLFSASHLASHSPTLIDPDSLLYLKNCALRSLLQLITSGKIDDEVIASTAKMASHEAIFGSESEYHIHMDAVRKMLLLRGGIEKLGMAGLLARLLLFIDTNSAYILGTHLHLDESNLPRREPLTFLNTARFVGEDQLPCVEKQALSPNSVSQTDSEVTNRM